MYLNKDLKIYYDEAFLDVKNCDHPFWGFDEGVEEHLIAINTNINISTLYSKWKHEPFLHSYLTFAYARNIEEILSIKILLNLEKEIKNINPFNSYKFMCNFKFPHVQSIEKNKTDCILRCITDSQYYNVHHVRLELKYGLLGQHQFFWNYLNTNLSKI